MSGAEGGLNVEWDKTMRGARSESRGKRGDGLTEAMTVLGVVPLATALLIVTAGILAEKPNSLHQHADFSHHTVAHR